MRPTAKSFLLDMLSTLGGRSMPVRALIEAAKLFGIESNSLRVALARLLAGDTVENDDRGEYRLGDKAQAVQQQVISWRRLEERVRAWDGSWIGVHTAAGSGRPRAERQRADRALRFLGFRELFDGLEIRPDNLAGGIGAVRQNLISLGLPGDAPVFGLSQLGAHANARARALWDARRLVSEYQRSCRDLERSEARLPTLSTAEAMVESFLLGGRVIRQLALDPLLPEPIIATEERRALVAAMQRYDRLGHNFWRGFFREYRVTSLRTPVDSKSHEHPETRLTA